MTSQAERQLYFSLAETVAAEFQQDFSEEWLEQVLKLALEQALPPDAPGQVSLLITDDATVRDLNRVYRGLDETTDVLSFSASAAHPGHWQGELAPPSPNADGAAAPEPAGPENWPPFILPPDELPPLGEIIISYPQARRQAASLNRPLDRELALLIVHAVLHLVGCDHVEPEETARMQQREQAALATLFQLPEAPE